MNRDFTVFVRHKGQDDTPWRERYQRETDDPETWGRALIDSFNATLRPGERAREFVRVEIHGEVAPIEHAWTKTSLVTQMEPGGRMFDAMKCDRCGITGKRYGLAAHVERSHKYRAKVYARCDTAAEQLREQRFNI